MSTLQQSIQNGIPEQRTTTWHNPTDKVQRVVIHEGNGLKFAFVLQPGETKPLDSRYDRTIHMVDCGQEECHRRGWFCSKGHDGIVVGGEAPLLKRVGCSDTLDQTLDPAASKRKEIEQQLDREIEREKIVAEARARRAAEYDAATATSKPKK
ncbi:MAG: hypothetical protein FWD17_14195 [Polyangiaceae bacterium]|nr:hypothetical protein [Polyangiaceae bacterium]